MGFIKWFLQNFGLFFGAFFIIYLYFIIKRLVCLYDILRHVPKTGVSIFQNNICPALENMTPYFERLSNLNKNNPQAIDAFIDCIWAEMESQVSLHFAAINGYIYSLILMGFAGTIFGSISAFTEMFQGLSNNIDAVSAFMKSWNSGLSTALYTSLGSACIGGFFVTIIYSKFFMTKAKRLESILAYTISEIMEKK